MSYKKVFSLVLAGLAFAASDFVQTGEARTGLLIVAGFLAGLPVPARPIAAGKATIVGAVLLVCLAVSGCGTQAGDLAKQGGTAGALALARLGCDAWEGRAIQEGTDRDATAQRLRTIRASCDAAYEAIREGALHVGLDN